MLKICNTCKVEKDISKFHKRKATRDGFHNTCKDCRKKESKEYYWSHREEIIERNSKFFLSHRDELYVYKRKWYESNPDKVKAGLDRKKKKPYYKINNKINKHKRRKLLDSILNDGTITKSSLELLYESTDNCIYCGIEKNENFHLDHIYPISKGGEHSLSNVRFICPKCNLRKHTKTHEEFIDSSPTPQ